MSPVRSQAWVTLTIRGQICKYLSTLPSANKLFLCFQMLRESSLVEEGAISYATPKVLLLRFLSIGKIHCVLSDDLSGKRC